MSIARDISSAGNGSWEARKDRGKKDEKPDKLLRLEALRGFAAVYVFAHHLVKGRLAISKGPLYYFFGFGQEAVILFFLLSGFVIYYSYSTGDDKSFTGYFFRRWFRIYPMYFLALGLSFLLSGGMDWKSSAICRDLAGNVFMLQDLSAAKPGVWFNVFCGNSPLWSLSYEWWFYMLFFVLMRFIGDGRRQFAAICIAAAGLASMLLWPNQISRFAAYFAIWWAGAQMARGYLSGTRQGFSSQKLSLVCLFGFVLVLGWWAARFGERTGIKLKPDTSPILEFRHFLDAMLFVAGGIIWSRFRWIFFSEIFGCFRFLAPVSYGIYILHYPIAIIGRWLPDSLGNGTQIALAVLAAFVAAYLAEFYYQPAFKRLTLRAGKFLANRL